MTSLSDEGVRPQLIRRTLIARIVATVLICWFSLPVRAQMTADAQLAAVPRVPISHVTPHGIARPRDRATMSAPAQGLLMTLSVKSGQRVERGEILAVIDNRVALAAVNAAQAAADRLADVMHARHALTLANSLFERHNALHDAQAGAEFELEQARVQRDQAAATLAAALEAQLQSQRNLELERARLESLSVRAPFDGEVVRLEATVGTSMAPSDKLLTIVNLDSLEAELHLPLDLFGSLQVGQTYWLSAFAPVNRRIPAQLMYASPFIDAASKSFRCLFTIDNRDRRLPAGFGVRFDGTRADPPEKSK